MAISVGLLSLLLLPTLTTTAATTFDFRSKSVFQQLLSVTVVKQSVITGVEHFTSRHWIDNKHNCTVNKLKVIKFHSLKLILVWTYKKQKHKRHSGDTIENKLPSENPCRRTCGYLWKVRYVPACWVPLQMFPSQTMPTISLQCESKPSTQKN